MALSLSEFQKNLVKALEALNQNRERDSLLSSRDGVALVKLRVINTGVNANGKNFTAYSRNPIPLYWLGSHFVKAPDFNPDAARERLKKKFAAQNKGKPKDQRTFASYFDWREILGRPTSFKNFSLTGDLWASIREFIKSKTKTSVVVELKSTYDFYNQTVIPAQNNREGISILKLKQDERNLVLKAFRDRRFQILRDNNVIK